MTLPSAKEIAALAKACRKAGITEFKGAGIEFKLSDAPPLAKASRKSKQTPPIAANDPVESDEPGYAQLLHWSVGVPEESSEQ